MFGHLLGAPFALKEIEIDKDRTCQPHIPLSLAKEKVSIGLALDDAEIAAFLNLAGIELTGDLFGGLIGGQAEADLGDAGQIWTVELRRPLLRDGVGGATGRTELIDPGENLLRFERRDVETPDRRLGTVPQVLHLLRAARQRDYGLSVEVLDRNCTDALRHGL
jgi:hypothetical protein